MSDAYHHGDLRRALLNEAAEVVATDGVGALSLRGLARRAGVSPTAPYHHFDSKSELICALAEEALGDLDAALADAASAHDDPVDRLRAQGIAYVLFAVDHPERFRLAFRPEMGTPFSAIDGGRVPENLTAFRQLVGAVRAVGGAEEASRAVAAWSLVHGLASLLVDGPLHSVAGDRDRVRALAEAVTSRLRP